LLGSVYQAFIEDARHHSIGRLQSDSFGTISKISILSGTKERRISLELDLNLSDAGIESNFDTN